MDTLGLVELAQPRLRHYAGTFEDVDPGQRVTAEAAIRAAREPGVRGVCALFDPTPNTLGS